MAPRITLRMAHHPLGDADGQDRRHLYEPRRTAVAHRDDQAAVDRARLNVGRARARPAPPDHGFFDAREGAERAGVTESHGRPPQWPRIGGRDLFTFLFLRLHVLAAE